MIVLVARVRLVPAPVALRARDRRARRSTSSPSCCSSCSGSLFVVSPHALDPGDDARRPSDLASARVLAAARDAGLHRARDRGQPGRGGADAGRRPAALGLRRDRDRRDDVRRDRGRRAVGVSRARRPSSARRWIRAPLARRRRPGSAASCPTGSAESLRIYVGLTGALILLAAVTTSISGFSRLAYSLGEHGQLPRSFGRLSRRAHVSPLAILSVAVDLLGGRRRNVVLPPRRRIPREPLLVRRPARVHRGPAGGDQAAHRRARARAAVSGAAERADPRRRDPAAGDRRVDRHVHDLDRRARDASRRPVRRARVARDRARGFRRGAASRTGKG